MYLRSKTSANLPGKRHITMANFDARYISVPCPVCCAPRNRDCKNKSGAVFTGRKVHQERQHKYSLLAGTATFLMLLLTTLLTTASTAQQLQHRVPTDTPVETCQEHVALTRHYLKDAAKVIKVRWERDMLHRAYLASFKDANIKAVCQDRKTVAEWDLDLADISLQAAYDRTAR